MMQTTISRRRALQVLGGATLLGAAGQLLSASRARVAGELAGPGLGPFTAVSKTLTGKAVLDPALGLALYHALGAGASDFDAQVAALAATLAQGTALAGETAAFSEGEAPQQALSRAILEGWYLGVVGKGRKAVSVAFVDALANRAVAGILTPPSYSYGPCGSWQARP